LELDAIVTLVDAKHVFLHIDDSEEVRQQIGFADVVILNKTDLVEESALVELERRVRSMNTMAKVLRAKYGDVPLEEILNVGGFNLDRIVAENPSFLSSEDDKHHDAPHDDHDHHHGHHHSHRHDESVKSLAFEFDQDMDLAKLNGWLGPLLAVRGMDIFRMKGILAVSGEKQRYVFQGVHMMFDGRPDRAWGANERRTSRLVFIGRNLDRGEFEAGLRECLA
jgi:G3E family GTPase